MSPDGRTVAAGDYSNRLIVWDLNTGKIRVRLGDQNNENQVQDVAYIGSTRLAVASSGGTVRIWDLHDPSRPQRTLDPGDEAGGITAMAVSRDGTHLFTVAEDRKLRGWNVSDGRPNVTIPTQIGTIKDIAFSPDGSLLVAGVADGTVHIWRWRDNRECCFHVRVRHARSLTLRARGHDRHLSPHGWIDDLLLALSDALAPSAWPAERMTLRRKS